MGLILVCIYAEITKGKKLAYDSTLRSANNNEEEGCTARSKRGACRWRYPCAIDLRFVQQTTPLFLSAARKNERWSPF